MWPIPLPNLAVGATFDTCISRIAVGQKLDKMHSVRESIIEASAVYEDAATKGATHELATADFKSADKEFDKELKKNYTDRMAAKKGPGRSVYIAIRDSVEHNICPMCGHRPISGLDHALPKTHFPLLAVTPSNLVPCCSDCNHDKREAVANFAKDGFLNPYFDDIDSDDWLVAKVVEDLPVAVVYGVKLPSIWDSELRDRVTNHFTSLGLANLYTAQAGRQIRALEKPAEKSFNRDGSEGVRETLRDHRDGWLLSNNNCWQAALFDALQASDWYCEGGFRT